ncbi:MAG: hypothetical protein Q9214_003300 [Letrouitia sp. 1 TL-2023]
MAHSKRNTSLAFFTSYEREQLKSSWGSQSTRLTRDSFLPFASCNLCLQPSRDPVACASHGDIFCRECIVSNLLAQRKEIKRLEKEEERRRREEEDEERERGEEEKERSIQEFEKTMMGLEQKASGKGSESESKYTSGRGAKRKFELDEEEMTRAAKDERAKARKALDEEKSKKPTLPSFWVPSLTPTTKTTAGPVKLNPVCPASSPSDSHNLSLKTVISINFTKSSSTADSSNPRGTGNKRAEDATLVCPACAKPLSNTLKAFFAVPCGHVLCKPCAEKFMSPSKPDPHAPSPHHHNVTGSKVVCFTCETDLSPNAGKENEGGGKKKDKEKGLPRRGIVEIRSEGTGFAGGGKNMTKKEGLAFQC